MAQGHRIGGRVMLVLLLAVAAATLGWAAASAAAARSSPGPVPGSTSAPPAGSVHSHVPPLDDPRGLHPGLTQVPRTALTAARKLIARVRTAAAGSQRGYTREQFGPAWTDTAQNVPWAGDGCDTRDDILQRDLTKVRFRAGTGSCVVLTGTLTSPYTGITISFEKAHATRVQIDHVIPLALAWRMGASSWTRAKRVQLANDPLNLLAVDQHSNTQKSDNGPANWLPANARILCAYSVRVAQVARKYDLPVTAADRTVMRAKCGG